MALGVLLGRAVPRLVPRARSAESRNDINSDSGRLDADDVSGSGEGALRAHRKSVPQSQSTGDFLGAELGHWAAIDVRAGDLFFTRVSRIHGGANPDWTRTMYHDGRVER